MKRFVLPLFALLAGCSGSLLPVAPQGAGAGAIALVASPVPAPSICANQFLPSPSPAPAGSFTYEIQTPATPPATEEMSLDGQHPMEYMRGQLFLNLVSESYAQAIMAKYDLAQVQQETLLPAPDATGAAAVTLRCPSFLTTPNHPEQVDLAGMGTLAEHFGIQGHFVFNEREAAAIFKLGFQIMLENPQIVTACGPNGITQPQ